MIHSVKFTCFLDTNVIYPILTRDILLWFAHYELYTPKWSPDIFTEWADVMRRKNVSEAEILKRIENVNLAFAGAMVQDYESITKTLKLPDLKDRHVLAAAIKSNADIIVTNNLKDFPESYLKGFNIAAKNADDFLTDLIDLNHEIALAAFQMMVSHKKNPDLDEYQVLDICRKNGLKDTADYLHALL
ncbi:PIN domain-containing protein [Aquirufa lenticrescens]|uniref:PIN domain-containing protein n=1 Tax=Aquirufa lenticrescens TaxID=2696560 RepID=UPI001CAA6729|nr:PIN domain-containing protein [Aquirufa lenticrescens]UAJ14077.1 PIN domain-containing protein [Aquirufa lenticrescens]